MLDTVAGVVFGIFLLSVAAKGNTQQMITLAKRDKAFVQWAVAVGILLYLNGIPELSGPVKWLILLAFLGLGLTRGEAIKVNLSAFWQSLGDSETAAS